jgi:hypothetical protein
MGEAKRGWVKTEQGWEPRNDRLQLIVFQIRAGRPFKAIAEQFGITVAAVSYFRHKAGIPRRKQPLESR